MYVIPIALFVSFLWGVQIICHKILLKKTNFKVIMVVGSIFYFICVALFTASYWNTLKKDIVKLDAKSILLIGFASICSAFIANLIYLYILKDHSSYVVSALIYSSPIFTLILAYLMLKEKVTFIGAIGVVLIVVGVICLSLNEKNPEEFLDIKEI